MCRFPFVCVSIGLTVGRVPTVGVVYNPIMNEVFFFFRIFKACTLYFLFVSHSLSCYYIISINQDTDWQLYEFFSLPASCPVGSSMSSFLCQRPVPLQLYKFFFIVINMRKVFTKDKWACCVVDIFSMFSSSLQLEGKGPF